jgi:hypothetical protein
MSSSNQSRSHLLFSIFMLSSVFAAMGWMVQTWNVSRNGLLWLLALTLLVNIVAVFPYRLVEILLTGIFGASFRSLLVVMGTATLAVVIIAWLPIVYYVLLILIATLLLRLDFYELEYNHWQSLLLLVVCQMMGLGIGWVGNIYWWRGVEYLQLNHFLGS